jgi:uncharacterized protein
MTNIQFIQNQVTASPKSIEATLKLLSEDCTIPFISRYRKDQTGNLDEVVIENIAKLSKQFDEIVKRKDSVLKSIEEQGQLTSDLKSKIENSFDLQEIEDLYLPYKKKKKTRADVARENGLEPLAKIIMAQNSDDIEFIASKYLNAKVVNEDDALQGARDIIAEWINENIYIRKNLRRMFQRKAVVETKVVKTKKDDEAAQKFSQYFDWAEPISKAPSHRLLAMLRAEAEGFVKLNVEIQKEEYRRPDQQPRVDHHEHRAHLFVGELGHVHYTIEQGFELREHHLFADTAFTEEHHGFHHLRLVLHAH